MTWCVFFSLLTDATLSLVLTSISVKLCGQRVQQSHTLTLKNNYHFTIMKLQIQIGSDLSFEITMVGPPKKGHEKCTITSLSFSELEILLCIILLWGRDPFGSFCYIELVLHKISCVKKGHRFDSRLARLRSNLPCPSPGSTQMKKKVVSRRTCTNFIPEGLATAT